MQRHTFASVAFSFALFFVSSLTNAFLLPQVSQRTPFQILDAEEANIEPDVPARDPPKLDAFDLDTALFAAGLAFDSYVEPPANSSRWEKGVRGNTMILADE